MTDLEVKVGYRGDAPPSAAEQVVALEAEIARLRAAPVAAPAVPLRLDLGCGSTPKEGFIGVDVRQFGNVGVVCDLAKQPWPWADSSVDEVHCSHMLEHVPRLERIHFVNELWRVLKPGAKATIITPHWASVRAYADVTHEWPPVVPMFWAYLDAEWRKTTPHLDSIKCDFHTTHGFASASRLAGQNPERLRYAAENLIDGADDMIATLTKKGG